VTCADAGVSNACSVPSFVVERRKHFWNGRWGRIARLDILIFEDAGRWLVEAREGAPMVVAVGWNARTKTLSAP